MRPLLATRAGRITRIDNRHLARVAKLAGAPRDPAAGLQLHVRLGDQIEAGQPLLTVHSEAAGELEYALRYAMTPEDIFAIGDAE
jgi:thymidine phosphorylase